MLSKMTPKIKQSTCQLKACHVTATEQLYHILIGTASLAAELIKIWGVLRRLAIRHMPNTINL